MMRRRLLVVCALALPLLAGSLVGCGGKKKIWVTQYPIWYTDEIKAIAVVPFENRTQFKGAGQLVSDDLAATMVQNATYNIYDRGQLKNLMAERDYQIAMGGDSLQIVKAFQKTGKVQAVLTGSVLSYSATSTRPERRQTPVYAYDNRGRQYIQRYIHWTYVRNEGTVTASAQLIRLPTGTPVRGAGATETVRIVSETKAPTMFSEAQPPQMDPWACADAARRAVVNKLLERFAVVRKRIEVDKNVLMVAREYYDGKWDEEKKYTPGSPMFVVLSLPQAADRNVFRIAIVRKDTRRDLWETQLVWSSREFGKSKGIRVDLNEIAAKGGGPGDYVVKAYSGPEPFAEKDFKIEGPRER